MARAPATAPTPWAVTRIEVPRSPASKSFTATAGMRAMNGERSRAATAMPRMAARQPGSAHAPRAPVTIRRHDPAGLLGIGPGRGQPDEGDGHEDGPERQGVDDEGERVRPQGQHHPGQRRSDDPAQVPLGRRQGDGAQQVVLGHQVGEDGLVGGEAEGGHAAPAQGHHGQVGRRHRAGGGQHRQQHGEDHLAQGGEQQDAPAVGPVGHRAPHRRQQADGQEGGRRHQARPPGLAGELGDEDADGHRLHPRADVGDEGRAPHQGEVAVAEGLERAEAPQPPPGDGGGLRLLGDHAGSGAW